MIVPRATNIAASTDFASLVLLKKAPHLASDADAMKLRMMVDVFNMAPFLCMVGRTDAVLHR